MRALKVLSFVILIVVAAATHARPVEASMDGYWGGGCGGYVWVGEHSGNCSQLFNECDYLCSLCWGSSGADPEDWVCYTDPESHASCGCLYPPA